MYETQEITTGKKKARKSQKEENKKSPPKKKKTENQKTDVVGEHWNPITTPHSLTLTEMCGN